MYIKILVYIIDNQQIKHKISIPFSARRSFAVPVSRSSWIGGAAQKRQPGRADFGEVVRPAYPPSHHTPPHPSNNVPHIILPEYPSYFLTTISPSISFNLLYLRYN